MSSDAVLELRSVSYRYAGAATAAIESVDLAVRRGEICGLTGPNEAGKTTICLVASGFAPVAIGGEIAGSVQLDGARLAPRDVAELAGRTALLLADATSLRAGMSGTVFEEIAIGPINLGLQVAETMERVRWAMAALGIEALAERHPAHVSGGQARLVAIASILAMRPNLVILDEPLGELDADGRDRLATVLRDLARAGTSILVAEHDTAFLAALSARIVAVREGRLE